LGRCLQKTWGMRLGQMANYPLFMALFHVDETGLPQDVFRDWHNSGSVEVW
jgi:hypothetical protein